MLIREDGLGDAQEIRVCGPPGPCSADFGGFALTSRSEHHPRRLGEDPPPVDARKGMAQRDLGQPIEVSYGGVGVPLGSAVSLDARATDSATTSTAACAASSIDFTSASSVFTSSIDSPDIGSFCVRYEFILYFANILFFSILEKCPVQFCGNCKDSFCLVAATVAKDD